MENFVNNEILEYLCQLRLFTVCRGPTCGVFLLPFFSRIFQNVTLVIRLFVLLRSLSLATSQVLIFLFIAQGNTQSGLFNNPRQRLRIKVYGMERPIKSILSGYFTVNFLLLNGVQKNFLNDP